ncbi:ATP-dependent (S)-NAD(P)H-hydrate dehydratase [Canna indica]|uniref:ATP-dependent (S)-NAD(P)H-hydrate dehydratase n=1 Tax=Canna indica TaxID=4628 RepID=A0AAQ3KLP4_9LILI|nr:ATP-dependent (S)-NAD(P)H-hydrate dehydratase [Canna indica]
MSSSIALSRCPENCMLASSAVVRRQLFLLRSLGGQCCRSQSQSMQGVQGASVTASEADAESIIRRITPALDPIRYKGQAGKIAVIGGCREYTGAPYFAAISALKLGADLSHVFCTKDAATVIKSYSPELIVHPVLEESYSVRDDEKASVSAKVLSEVGKWMERFDCVVVGPGLGRDPFLMDCVSDILRCARQSSIPTVIDGDGMFLVTNNLELVSGNSLAVLTPNINEYKRLVEKALDCEVNDKDGSSQLQLLSSRIGGVTILRKGKSDFVSDGEAVHCVSTFGSPRRCGGQGDILSGSVAVFSSWARHYLLATNETSGRSLSNPMVLGCIAGAALLRRASAHAFQNKKRATLTTDIIEHLGNSLEGICPAE